MKTALVGSKQIGLDALRRLQAKSVVTAIITVDDRADRRSRLPEFVSEGALVAHSRGDADAAIHALDADLVLVAGWYWLIRVEELNRRRFLGLHHSLLPKYRGGSPLVWALIEGETVVGTSLFELTESADAGPIWAQTQVSAGEGYIGNVAAACDAAGVGMIDALFDPHASGTPQNEIGASWRPQRHPADGLIDWTKPAVDVQRWIRAQSEPYPGAFSFFGKSRLTIWRARALPRTASGIPGTVSAGMVTCGDGMALAIEAASQAVPDGAQLSGPSHQ